MAYTVRKVPTPVNTGMFQVYDDVEGKMVGRMHYSEADADKVALRLNTQDKLLLSAISDN